MVLRGGAVSYERDTPVHNHAVCAGAAHNARREVQEYLAHKKQPPSLEPPHGPRHSPTAGSQGGAVSDERGPPALAPLEGLERREKSPPPLLKG